MTNHDTFYKAARFYDIAFDFKDVPGECDFLLEILQKHSDREAESFLECAAGPALHSLEFAKRGLHSIALDSSPAMVCYGKQRARAAGVDIDYVEADMSQFNLDRTVDLAAILMDSTSYLLDNRAVLDHLACMGRALRPGGLYILEMSHPRDVYNAGKSAQTEWTAKREDTKVHIRWGRDEDFFDPCTGITHCSVRLDYEDGSEVGSILDKAPQRSFTANEWLALVEASESFEILEIYGAMDSSIPFDNRRPAWRMVPILQRV